jgi:hypothetical protein
MGCTACTDPQCLYKGALYLYLTVELYLYSPYGSYGLYRASVPVQGVHFTFTVVSSAQNIQAVGYIQSGTYSYHRVVRVNSWLPYRTLENLYECCKHLVLIESQVTI